MAKNITSIIVTFIDGTTEKFPNDIVKLIQNHRGDHKTVAGFIGELLHEWDKDSALESQQEEHEQELAEVRKELDDYHKNGLNIQRGKLDGLLWDKWAECLPDFPYNPLDIVPIPQPGDRICFNGMISNNITEIIWLEYQIKNGVYERRKKQIRECLSNGKFRYELYIPPKHWEGVK